MGQGRQSVGPTRSDNDGSRSSADCCTRDRVSTQPDPPLQVARATRDSNPFRKNQFQALWEQIKAWVKTDDIATFYNIWEKISSDPSVPESVVKYLKAEWLPVVHRWSMIGRRHRSIFEEGETNMLIESYVVYLSCEIINLIEL